MIRLSAIVSAVIVAMLGITMFVATVSAYTLYATIQVQNSAATAYPNIGITATKDMANLASNYYILSSGLDVTVVEGVTAVPAMVADDRLNFVKTVGASGTVNAQFRAGNTAAASMPIVPGYNGYVTTADAAALELGSTYEVEIDDTYFDVGTRNTGAVQTKKVAAATNNESFRIQTDGNGSIVAQNYGTVTTQDTYDSGVPADALVWGVNWYAQTFTASANYRVASVEFFNDIMVGNPGDCTLSIRATAAGAPTGVDLASYTIAQANMVDSSWLKFHVPPIALVNGTVYAIILRAPAGTAANRYLWEYRNADAYAGGSYYSSTDSGATWASAARDFSFKVNLTPDTVEASGLTSAVRDVKVTQDGTGGATEMNLWIDGVLIDTVTPATSAVPNNAASYVWLPVQSAQTQMGYLGNVLLTVGGVQVLRYEPNDMIHTTVMPDRDTADGTQNGVITWGANPGTFTVTWGSLTSTSQPAPTSGEDLPTQDVLDPVTLPSMTGSGVSASFPLQPLVGAVTGVTNFTESQVWLWIAFWGMMAMTILLLIAFQNLFLLGGGMIAMDIVLYKIGIVPWWTILVFCLILGAMLVMERKQSF